MGGRLRGEEIGSCLKLDAKSANWRETARMSEARRWADCAAFQGRIVVTGGSRGSDLRGGSLDSVEAYDHVGDEWTKMPSMMKRRCVHKAVAAGSKLYVIGGCGGYEHYCFEAFDSVSGKFALVSQQSQCLSGVSEYFTQAQVLHQPAEVFAVGSKLAVFGNVSEYAYFYDVESGEWSEEELPITETLQLYCGAKVPHA